MNGGAVETRLVEALVNHIDALALEQITLVGGGFGRTQGGSLAARRPGRQVEELQGDGHTGDGYADCIEDAEGHPLVPADHDLRRCHHSLEGWDLRGRL